LIVQWLSADATAVTPKVAANTASAISLDSRVMMLELLPDPGENIPRQIEKGWV
jgi:hypothetical protein